MQPGSPLTPRVSRLDLLRAVPAIGAFGVLLLAAASLAMPLGVSSLLTTGLAAVTAGLALAAHQAWSDRAFGLADGVTLVRAGLAATLLAPAIEDLHVPPSGTLALTALLLLALDGLDGWIARRRGEASPFGARFDMEADTLLLAVLALLVLLSGRAGAWVLLAPALRPAFVIAGRVAPWLSAPLPASSRRKLCCVAPLAALSLALAPSVGAPLATLLALSAVLVLASSFALDLCWLAARRGAGSAP